GNEMLYLCLVFPILDPEGRIVNLYGRNTRPDTEIPHLYLPGPRKGVFNYPGIKGSDGSVILTEGILDALSLIQLGFANTTCAWGTNGFTADILAALQRNHVATVFVTYDNDHAGNPAAEQLAYRLAPHGITTRRIELPEKDPNAFLVAGHTAQEFATLLAVARDLTPATHLPRLAASPAPQAQTAESTPSPQPTPTLTASEPTPIPKLPETAPQEPRTDAADQPPQQAASVPGDPEPEPAAASPTSPTNAASAATAASSLSLVTAFGPRVYRMAPPRFGSPGLRVTLRLEIEGKAFLHRFDLTNDSARSFFVGRAAKLFPSIERRTFEEDLFALIDQLEERQLKKENSKASFTPQAPDMSAEEEAEALAFLRSPALLADLVRDLEIVGLVGETVNKVLLYLIATSRLLFRPLSAVLLSGSSAGKSFLLKLITDLMPSEQVFRYTRISAQALFYKETDALKHKLVLIEEAEGATDADYPLRVMQSDRSLRNLVTIKDPATGQMTTQETEVEGPIALLVSSTAASIHYENATRSFELG
ncbi:MAG: toprim domain-containing protein, partial [Rhodocyclales bacterium]|nr:toprim domain-containing protein [Rhodocyclales bacterium]